MQPLDWVFVHTLVKTKRQIGGGADAERDLPICEKVNQTLIFDRTDPVVDPIRAKDRQQRPGSPRDRWTRQRAPRALDPVRRRGGTCRHFGLTWINPTHSKRRYIG